MDLLVVAWHPILVLRYSSPRWDLWELCSRQRDGDTSANERTIDGTDDDLNDCPICGASHYRRSQLHRCAQGLAHIWGIK